MSLSLEQDKKSRLSPEKKRSPMSVNQLRAYFFPCTFFSFGAFYFFWRVACGGVAGDFEKSKGGRRRRRRRRGVFRETREGFANERGGGGMRCLLRLTWVVACIVTLGQVIAGKQPGDTGRGEGGAGKKKGVGGVEWGGEWSAETMEKARRGWGRWVGSGKKNSKSGGRLTLTSYRRRRRRLAFLFPSSPLPPPTSFHPPRSVSLW